MINKKFNNDIHPIYFNPVDYKGTIVSIDNLKVACILTDDFRNKLIQSDGEFLLDSSLHCASKEQIKSGYKYTIKLEDGNSIFLMVFTDSGRSYIKCNPNKCFRDKHCLDFVKFWLSKSLYYHIQYLDIAIDIPINRNYVYMDKGKQKLNTFKSSKKDAGTVYNGKRSSNGNVKLYDKSKESGLSKAWTRVEITQGNPMEDNWEAKLKKCFPKLFIRIPDGWQTVEEELSSTDKALLYTLPTCKDFMFAFGMLDYKKQKKLKPFLLQEDKLFDFDVEPIKQAVSKIYDVIGVQSSVFAGNSILVTDNQKVCEAG